MKVGTISPLIISLQFPKRGNSSRKWKRRSDDKLYKKIAKLEKNPPAYTEIWFFEKEIVHNSLTSSALTPEWRTLEKIRAVGIRPFNAPEIPKQLLFADTISRDIRKAGKEKKNKKENICTLLSGRNMKK